MNAIDHTLENLLELNGERILIDESLGLWVKFEVIKTQSRQQGIKYSLTLHDKSNNRILGFDNSHEIKYGHRKGLAQKEPLIIGILMRGIKEDLIIMLMQGSF